MFFHQASVCEALTPCDSADNNSAILELRAGAGGEEAALFTGEILMAYQKLSAQLHWSFEELHRSESEKGGIKVCKIVLLLWYTIA